MNVLVGEFLAAINGLDNLSRHWLIAQGVPPGIIEVSPGPVTVATIETDSLGTFQFSESGIKAFVHPITSGGAFTDIFDLVAWRPSDPTRWWTRLYSGIPLGDDQLFHAAYWEHPVMLRATPLDWLCAGGDGVCIVDWKTPAPELRTVPELICETVDHGEEVLRCLTAPMMRIPPITILKKDAA
jgi:hypothetical protein